MFHSPIDGSPEIVYILRIFTHALALYIGDLSNVLTVTFGRLYDDVQRRDAGVVGQIGTDAEGYLAPILEVSVNLVSLLEVKTVREQECLLSGVNSQFSVVLQHLLSPLNGVARVVPDTREEGGVGELEVP